MSWGEVKHLILDDLESIVADLLGAAASPRHRRRGAWNVASPWRARSKPSQTIIRLSGPKRGSFVDFLDGSKGDAIGLVAWALTGRTDRAAQADAVKWAEARFGIAAMPEADRERLRAEASARRTAMAARAERDLSRRRERARKFFYSCQPSLIGTVAETYLAGRGIPLAEIPHVSAGLRFHPACEWWEGAEHDAQGRRVRPGPLLPAIICAMVDATGKLGACHYTFLDPSGRGKARVDKPKLMFPETHGLVVRVTHGPSGLPMEKAAAAGVRGPAGVTEGLEDALTAGWADPDLRMLMAGSLSGLLAVPDHDAVNGWIVFRDNDWDKPQAVAQFERAMTRFRGFGKPAIETHVPADLGKDLNDLIQSPQEGPKP